MLNRLNDDIHLRKRLLERVAQGTPVLDRTEEKVGGIALIDPADLTASCGFDGSRQLVVA